MELEQFFAENPKVAIAFSGGVDSAYLLYAGVKSGAKIKAYFVKSAFQPDFELEDALRLAQQLHAEMEIIRADILCSEIVAANPADRCYHCKKVIFSYILEAAKKDGFSLVLDGTNASDRADDRPGMRALQEMSVRSPLRECGLTKEEIRKRSKEAGLFTWDKPAYACLATRIPTGDRITAEKLEKTEKAERYLFSLGFEDFRIRLLGNAAKIQVPVRYMEELLTRRKQIVAEMKRYYSAVLLDLEARDE